MSVEFVGQEGGPEYFTMKFPGLISFGEGPGWQQNYKVGLLSCEIKAGKALLVSED